MTSKVISYETLNDAIRIAFENDEDLLSFYDPNKQLNSIEEIISDVAAKIKTHDNGELVIRGIYEGTYGLMGYFVFKNRLLISFGMDVKYRNKRCLKTFWKIIKREMNDEVACMLWSKNIRAIKWLAKNGMKVLFANEQVTQLVLI